ncbi:cytochrome P450 [Eremomyces bilateralis CBS 781.70]|uniref:Cytochrome P450 n=1 Tax=Eremomyces bilateralis CBS 781.70 TaxID=1392243 RepID=A0A6G1GCK6_9PEZI|nr:cytochrome P450 [Eremomyces bilateralis CBS 781.70]KAF1815825.1 cytochrome P450 [Eremomyces bilateralis CBS 781.70]
MGFPLIWVSYALLAYAAVSYIRSYLTERRFQQYARQHQCEEARKNTLIKWPWALDGHWRAMKAVSKGADFFDDVIIPRYEALNTFTIASKVFGLNVLETIEPKNLQAILATNFKDFDLGDQRNKQLGAVLGHSIFTSDGEFWAHSRALFRPSFNRENINNFEATARAANILVEVLPEGSGGWTKQVNLMDYFYRFTLDTATAFLFGHTTDSQLAAAGRLTTEQDGTSSAAISQKFEDAFTTAQEWLSLRLQAGNFYWLVQGPKWWRARQLVQQFVNQYVELALNARSQSEKMNSDKENKYNLLKELATECGDPIELRDQLTSILGAGRDTTAALLAWIFVELAKNPRVFSRLREAILFDFGESEVDVSSITSSKLKSCRYLQFVIQEALRIHPPVPTNGRQAIRNTTLPVGGGEDGTKPVAVRKGQTVVYSILGVHKRKDIWGEDADEFRPERWEGRKISWSYVPFSGGPRICIGQQYAITEASFLTVRLLQAFDTIEWRGETGRITKGFGLTMYPAKGVPVLLRRAAASRKEE